MCAGRKALAFTIGGPVAGESYQTDTIGYGLTGDILSPRSLNQEYRYNTPIMYYAYDSSFLTFFGSNGISAVDGAMGVLNALTNVSSYSQGLTEFPQNTTRFNYTATQLGLVDLKSTAMSFMLEELALGVPDRWVWTLRFRDQETPGPCPADVLYGIIERNIDPVTWNYSTYVDGTQYGFTITETCQGPTPAAPEAVTVPYPVNPTDLTFLPVASQSLYLGGFFGGLTRDDVGGLRYELSKSQVFYEATGLNSLLITQTAPTNIVTSNYLQLQSLAAMETPTQLASNYPNLTITSSTLIGSSNVVTVTFTNVVTTNFPPYLPAGQGVVVTNQVPVFTTNFQPVYTYTFGNILNPLVYFDGGVLVTNFNEFIFNPTNSCGFTILSNLNIPVVVTNTNTSPIVLYTNHTLAIELPSCVSNTAGLYQGVEKLNFYRKDFDSLLGQLWTPVTNTYHRTFVTNGTSVVQTFSRVVTAPDFVFSASDQDPNTSILVRFVPAWVKDTNAPQAAGGPGIINPQPVGNTGAVGTIDFTSVNPLYTEESGSLFLNDYNATLFEAWGSFDGTTNLPITYPSSASLSNLENLLYLQFTVGGPLPNGSVSASIPYSFQLTAQGQAPPPYNWSIDPTQGGLPPGLSLGFFNGRITGTPTTVGVFDFAVQLSDSTGRVVERNFSIQIGP